MKLAAILSALGMSLAILALTPTDSRGNAWVAGIVLLNLWIIATPFLFSLRPRGKTDAGWLAGLGLYSVAIAAGQGGAVAGLLASVATTERIAYALYVVTSLPALALTVLSQNTADPVERISSGKAFKSRHFHWNERLEMARTASRSDSFSRALAHCSDLAVHAARDRSAAGVELNTRIDAVVEKLCESESLGEPGVRELVHTFELLLREREFAIRS